jgi:putative membrane protein insertion efficiency factor
MNSKKTNINILYRLIYYTQLCIIKIIVLYKKLISPMLPNACRFTPTCSEYMIEAIKLHGTLKGIYLGLKRIIRCNPWGKCGHDPVPAQKKNYTHTKQL